MNTKIFLIALSAAFAFGIAQADPTQDVKNLANAGWRSNNADWQLRSEVHANAEKAFAAYAKYASTTNVPAKELDNLLGGALCAANCSVDPLFARAEAERALSNDTLSAGTHFQAVRYLAAGDAEKGRFALAEARYDAYLKDHPFNVKDPYSYAGAWDGLAKLKWLQHDNAGAVAVLEKGIAGMPQQKKGEDMVGWARNQAMYRFRDALLKYLPIEKRFDYFVSKGWRAEALSICFSLWCADDKVEGGEKAKALARKMLTEKNASFGERLMAWRYLFPRDPAFADAHEPLRPTDDAGCTNGVIHNLRWDIQQIYLINSSYENTIRAWKVMHRHLVTMKRGPEFDPFQRALYALARQGDRKGFNEAAEFFLAGKKIPDDQRYEVSLAVELLKMSGTPEAIAAQIAKVEPTLAGKLPAKQRLARYDAAARMAVGTMDDNLTHAVVQYRQKVMPDFPKKTYVVKYSDIPVMSSMDFARLQFKPVESALDRPYGGENNAFLETDVATGDRGNATKGGDGTAAISVVADLWGVHILRIYRDKRARDFERGFLDPGSFEEYIAPGADQPYTCILFAPKKGSSASLYPTSYDAIGHTRIDAKNPASFRNDVTFTDDAIYAYTGIAWNNFPTLVPTDGMTWDFESCFWGPKTCAWNGLKTVHGRSTWGLLKFEMPEKARLAVLKDQICRATKKYRDERRPNKVGEGILSLWQDPVMGDKAFYEAKLVPLTAELDAVAKRVKSDMTDADVKDIAENYLEKLAYFRIYVDSLRAEWLKEQL